MRRAGVLFLGAVAIAGSPEAMAYSAGIAGRATIGCGGAGCHGSVASPSAVVDLDLPSTLPAGQGTELTVSIDDPTVPPGGLNHGGFNLRAPVGSLSLLAASPQPVQLFGKQEAGHTTAGNDQRAWTVRWDPPGIPTTCEFPFNAASNAVNGDGVQSELDHWNLTPTRSIVVDSDQDAVDPEGRFENPREGWVHFGGVTISNPGVVTLVIGDVDIEVTADDDTGIATVEVSDTDLLGESSLGEATYQGIRNGTNLFRLPWAASTETRGPHTLKVTVTDCAGRFTESFLELFVL